LTEAGAALNVDLLLAHHPPSRYDRCIRVGGRPVCRRCAVLYPVAFAVMIASLLGWHWPPAWDRSLLMLLPLPVTLELVLERFGAARYRPLRQIVLTIAAAPALGRGFARYLFHPADRLFWGMVLLFGGTSLLVLLATRGEAR
jgi:hypothetical protein